MWVLIDVSCVNYNMKCSVAQLFSLAENPSVHPEENVGSNELKRDHAAGGAPLHVILKKPHAGITNDESTLPSNVVLEVTFAHQSTQDEPFEIQHVNLLFASQMPMHQLVRRFGWITKPAYLQLFFPNQSKCTFWSGFQWNCPYWRISGIGGFLYSQA